MDSVKALLKLEFRARFGSINLREIKSFIKYAFLLLVSGLMYGIYLWGAKSFLLSCYIYDMQYIFLVFFIGLVDIVMLFMGISTIVKNLFFSGDNEILLRFPVKDIEVFSSKILYVLIVESISSVVLLLPVFIMFGVITGQNALFYFMIPLVTAMCILLPFLLANICAIPFMYVKTFLQNKFAALLVIFVLGVAGGFAVYMMSVQGLLSFMEEESMNFFSSNFTVILSGLTDWAVPFRQLANIMMGLNVGSSILILLSIFVLVTVVAYFIVRKLYIVAMIKNLEIEGSSFVKKTQDKVRAPFNALIRREFLDIFRSSNYSFQYLSMACGAPVMVYFCNRLAVFVGETNIGNGVLPALTMLVMLIFISLIVSFSASSISREGGNFYITKMVPISYLTEVSVKFVLYISVALAAVTLSFGLLLVFKYVEPVMALIMYGASVLFAVAETCFSIKLDIKRHSFAVGGDGELTVGTPATFISMFTGLVLAVFTGIFGMVMSYFIDVKVTFLIVLGVAFVLAVLAVCWLFFRLNRNYDKIEQR